MPPIPRAQHASVHDCTSTGAGMLHAPRSELREPGREASRRDAAVEPARASLRVSAPPPTGRIDRDRASRPRPASFEGAVRTCGLAPGAENAEPGGVGKRVLSAEGEGLAKGLEWLADHQSPDGSWTLRGFLHDHAPDQSCACEDAAAIRDVGATGLALLAFLGDGNTTRQGPFKEVVSRGVNRLREQQDLEAGLIGTRGARSSEYDHAIATLAICEAYFFTKNPLIRSTARKAIRAMLRPGIPHSAWRYDSSATGWILLALESAERGGIPIPNRELAEFFASFGVAVAVDDDRLGCCADGRSAFLEMRSHGRGMGAMASELYFDALAAHFVDGGQRTPWRLALEDSLRAAQRTTEDGAGCWDPQYATGPASGRVRSTALALLVLEVPYRFVLPASGNRR